MHSKVFSASVDGLTGYIVEVEVDLSPGLPSISIVGLPDVAVKESRERVTSAIRNSGFDLPVKKTIINLAPADIKKEGPGFDLPIAIGILKAMDAIKRDVNGYVICGELSLDGSVRPVKGVLPMSICVKNSGFEGFILPKQNSREAAITGTTVYPVNNLIDVVNFLNGEMRIDPVKVNIDEFFGEHVSCDVDFSEIKFQNFAKRALEISAAGGHNVLMVGPPGTGKTMLARRLPTILPDLTFDEAIDTTIIYSVAGLLPADRPILTTRPFRSPHHTISDVALIGGGVIPRPGEISLAHNGVLFLDELPEYHRDVIEALRQPLEDSKITISRASSTATFPANFILVAAMNPCPCGYYGQPTKTCTCTPYHIHRYISKISAPLLDRIDIHIEVPSLKPEEMICETSAESSAEIRKRVATARKIQLERFKDEKPRIYTNSQMTPKLIKKYCQISKEIKRILIDAIQNLGFSARAYDKVLKIARTIADLEQKQDIDLLHVTEAIQYRTLDRLIV